MKISVLGPQKNFSDLAYKKYDKSLEPVYFNSIYDVIMNVNKNIQRGIIPIENMLDGYVEGTLDLLLRKNLRIIDELFIPVGFSLVSNTSKIEDIKLIYVQYKAKGQCLKFLESMDAKIILTESNMESLSRMEKEDEAAIVPHHVYDPKKFGIADVTDSKDNETRFVVIGEDYKEDIKGEVKSLLCITSLVDRPGILYKILGEFSKLKLNLTSIMSRPTKEKMGQYNFFIELCGEKENILKIIDEFEKNKEIKIVNLGIYKKAR